MRTSTSTLGQEVQLAQAYLNIERIRARGQLDFAFDVPDRLIPAAFPPMVLLPLIEADAPPCDGITKCEGEVLRVEARADGGTLKVIITASMHGTDAQPAKTRSRRYAAG